MIKINKVRKEYLRCNSCYKNKETSGVEVYEVLVGLEENHTQNIRLCTNCLGKLKNDIENVFFRE